jgi:prevent-host-death family protein
MAISLTEDIRSVTDLKRNAQKILDHMHKTGRPVILTKNGKADAVLLDAKSFERHLKASNLARLLAPAEEDIAAGRESEMGQFLQEFKHAHAIPSKGDPKSKGGHR